MDKRCPKSCLKFVESYYSQLPKGASTKYWPWGVKTQNVLYIFFHLWSRLCRIKSNWIHFKMSFYDSKMWRLRKRSVDFLRALYVISAGISYMAVGVRWMSEKIISWGHLPDSEPCPTLIPLVPHFILCTHVTYCRTQMSKVMRGVVFASGHSSQTFCLWFAVAKHLDIM